MAIFTTCQRCSRKVMFSVVSVCHSFHREHITVSDLQVPPPHPGHETSLYRDPPPFWTWDLTVQGPPTSDIWWPRLSTCSNLFTWEPRPVLTSSGYWSRYGWPAGGTRPPGMLSSLLLIFTATRNGGPWSLPPLLDALLVIQLPLCLSVVLLFL